jgi:uncharacterized protein
MSFTINAIKVKFFCLPVFALILMSRPCCALQLDVYRSVKEVPNPKSEGGGYISDPQGVLSGSQKDSLNTILETLDQKTGVEAAVVIINDFDPNQDDFSFATNLFREFATIYQHQPQAVSLYNRLWCRRLAA